VVQVVQVVTGEHCWVLTGVEMLPEYGSTLTLTHVHMVHHRIWPLRIVVAISQV